MVRLLAIAFVWVGCAVAWVILGSTLVARTNEASTSRDGEVHALWGPPGNQLPPTAVYTAQEAVKEVVTTTDAAGVATQRTVEKLSNVERPLALDASDITVDFDLEHRKKGLLWFPTYQVRFAGRYVILNQTDAAHEATLRFPLNKGEVPTRSEGTQSVSFDGFRVTDAEGKQLKHEIHDGVATWTVQLAAGARHEFSVEYRSRGTSNWKYSMTANNTEVRNFRLRMATSFPNVDFPVGTTSPSRHGVENGRWRGEWAFTSLVAGSPIGIEMPQLLNPGPLASKVTFFAPLSLLFFFFVVAILSFVRKHEMHPMHYLLLGCAFFAFHLLFAYLVDHVAIAASFAIASVVSVFLVVSYARLFVGWRFALVEMGISQIIYLVLFSLTFFWEGYTGLAIAIGATLTLFLVMQITGRFDFAAKAKPPTPTPLPPEPPLGMPDASSAV
ncbi:MAG: inner membrane CreD family protein [Myxococcota bacterium]